MSPSQTYKRKIGFRIVAYKLLLLLDIILMILMLIKNEYDYLILLLIFYLIIETFLSPKMITINHSQLIITRLYLGGLFKMIQAINLSKIINILSIGLDIMNESYPEDVTGIVLWAKTNGEKSFDLYQIEYLDNSDMKRKVKLNMHINEYNMLLNIFLPAALKEH